MVWREPTDLKCPRCSYVTRTRKKPGDLAVCSSCGFDLVVGDAKPSTRDHRFKSNKTSRPTETTCDKCGHTIRSSKPSGSITHCSKCWTPVPVA